MQSERKYVQMLEIVRDVYVTPLKAALSSNRAILSAANIQIIFSDILRILSLNRWFLDTYFLKSLTAQRLRQALPLLGALIISQMTENLATGLHPVVMILRG